MAAVRARAIGVDQVRVLRVADQGSPAHQDNRALPDTPARRGNRARRIRADRADVVAVVTADAARVLDRSR